jgi:hypothetical protein
MTTEYAPLIKASINRQLEMNGLREVLSGGDLQVSALALAESIRSSKRSSFRAACP